MQTCVTCTPTSPDTASSVLVPCGFADAHAHAAAACLNGPNLLRTTLTMRAFLPLRTCLIALLQLSYCHYTPTACCLGSQHCCLQCLPAYTPAPATTLDFPPCLPYSYPSSLPFVCFFLYQDLVHLHTPATLPCTACSAITPCFVPFPFLPADILNTTCLHTDSCSATHGTWAATLAHTLGTPISAVLLLHLFPTVSVLFT